MSADAADPYADHEVMTDHWWWRPGWRVGTRFYAWHITLDGQDALHTLADQYVKHLAKVPTLDLIPPRWRHITLQGLGHVDQVSIDQLDNAVQAVSHRLAHLDPITSTYQRAVVFAEAVSLPPSNPAAYAQLRDSIRAGISDAWGETPEKRDGFRAHASLAYSNGNGNGRAIRAVLDSTPTTPATVRIDSVSLIRMHRDNRMYEWTTIRTVALGDG